MSDLFTSLVAISPLAGRVAGQSAVPAASPTVKGLSSGRQTAPTGLNPRGHALTGFSRFLWKLDEPFGSDSPIDATGNYPLTVGSGFLSTGVGQIGIARHFNDTAPGSYSGASDLATVSKLARVAGNWTLGFWINIPTVDPGPTSRGVMTLCEIGDPDTAVFYLKTSSASLFMGSTAGGEATTNISFTGLANQFVHCVLAWNGSTMKAWRNGSALADPSIPAPSALGLATPTWVLGYGQGIAIAGLDCFLDDVWFEDSLWTTPQVLNDYQRGRGL